MIIERKKYIRLIVSIVLIAGFTFGFILFSIVVQARTRIYSSVELVDPTSVAIVFGAGLTVTGKPSDMLSDRLSIAADLYHSKKVETILVSGDNQTDSYSEPDAMRKSLINDFAIPDEAIVLDYAGRRTYDTCVRAHTLWGVDHAVLVSQGYHLARAIWTCEHVGIQSVGVNATLREYVYERNYKLRELLAMMKAVMDVYVLKPAPLGGMFEKDLDP